MRSSGFADTGRTAVLSAVILFLGSTLALAQTTQVQVPVAPQAPAAAQSRADLFRVAACTGCAPLVPLWPNGAPGALGTADTDVPTLETFLPAQTRRRRVW